jgi:microcompartment protein CcmK/EutM
MFLGKVIGTVWSTVKWPGVSGMKLLVVRPYHLADLPDTSALADHPATPNQKPKQKSKPGPPHDGPSPHGSVDCEAVVCVDLLDAGVGDDVVVAFGHAARVAAQAPGSANAANAAIVPIDAAVVAIVDSLSVTRPST